MKILLCCLVLAAGSCMHALAGDDDRRALLDGVKEIAAPGLPGGISVFSDAAFAVVSGNAGSGVSTAVVAASNLGRGRVVALGHDGYFGAEALHTADTGRLMVNAVRWASRGSKATVGCVGADECRRYLEDEGIVAKTVSLNGDLKGVTVLVVPLQSLSPQETAKVARVVKSGVGLITGGPAWGFLQLNPGKSVADYPLNPMLIGAGLAFADGTPDRTSEHGYDASLPLPKLLNAATAAEALLRGGLSADESRQAVSSVMSAALSVPPGKGPMASRIAALKRRRESKSLPTHDKPLTMKQPLARLILALDIHDAMMAPPEKARAHPAATVFPGAPPSDAPRPTREIVVDTSRWGWRSLGMYAAPGEVVHVTLPRSTVNRGFALQIGCHTDTLWHLDSWQRAPAIVRRFVVTGTEMRIANAFGGLVYLDVPRASEPRSVRVTIAGAVEAPMFVLGKTDPALWRTRLRSAPAPWAELEGERIILTVPSRVVRDLDDPAAVLRLWDAGADAMADLADIPRERKRPERYVNDEQISAGYMHSGYPIMTFTDVSEHFVNAEENRLGIRSWGQWHELGHNHQRPAWTFDGTGEVTNNVFALYVFHTLCGIEWTASPHPALSEKLCRARLEKYLQGGAKFEEWKKDPFLALHMYIQLIDGFGWDALKKVLAEYRSLNESHLPHSDLEKRDQWMMRYSRAVGRNLGPFFQAWGVPTSDKARSEVATLPSWMPADFPVVSAVSAAP